MNDDGDHHLRSLGSDPTVYFMYDDYQVTAIF